jgi:hypothetical protein
LLPRPWSARTIPSVNFKYYPELNITKKTSKYNKKQGDQMRRIISIFLSFMLILSFLALFGCKEPEPVIIYVCENGQEVPKKAFCRDAVKKSDAESYAKRYVSAYFNPYGGKSQLVSSYLDAEQGDYFATFVVSEKDGEPYETVVSINGMTGKVNCTEKCGYIQSD